MSYAPSRSCNGELTTGLTEGSYKRVIRDRGGFPEATTYLARKDLADIWFGIHEEPEKVTPDGVSVTTPDYVATPKAELD